MPDQRLHLHGSGIQRELERPEDFLPHSPTPNSRGLQLGWIVEGPTDNATDLHVHAVRCATGAGAATVSQAAF